VEEIFSNQGKCDLMGTVGKGVLLTVRNLVKEFGGLQAINNLNFEVNKGEILGIIGPNGAGKSTLFNLLTGVLSSTKGEIIFDGSLINGLPSHVLAQRGIARTFQTTRIFMDQTVLNNIMIALVPKTQHSVWNAIMNRRKTKREENGLLKRCEELIRFIGIEEKANGLAGELGQEEQKRLAIGIAMATEPKLLLLDEPTGGINIEEINHLMDVIRKIWNKGITICLIEHKMKMVMELCERIIVLNYGTKIAEGTPTEVRRNEAAIKAYLGEEYAA
jgi:branched-chain amino acid transport system ATP-binding protein